MTGANFFLELNNGREGNFGFSGPVFFCKLSKYCIMINNTRGEVPTEKPSSQPKEARKFPGKATTIE